MRDLIEEMEKSLSTMEWLLTPRTMVEMYPTKESMGR